MIDKSPPETPVADSILSAHVIIALFFTCMKQKMDRARSYETGIFKKPGDFIQMFKVWFLHWSVRRP